MLVTGGSSGIGRSIAHAFAAKRAEIVITGRNVERLAHAADSSERIESVVCDITDDGQVAALHQQMSASGGIDMLVNCAGVMHFFDVTSGYPLERQLAEVDIDVSGPIRMVAAFPKGLEAGDDEIAPGQSKQLKWMSRIAPGFIFGQLNKATPS